MIRLLALEAVLLGLFVALALYTTGVPQPIDLEILAAIRGWEPPWFERSMAIVTHLGNAPVLVPVVLATVVLLAVRRNPRAALVVALVGVADLILDGALKALMERDRPPSALGMWSWSFPSGHTMSAMAVWGIVLAGVSRAFSLSARARLGVLALHVFLALSVGLSRVALGVHWPTDVVAGFAMGGILLALGMTAMRRWADTRTPVRG